MNNDIVTKARLNAALGTEGNMGFEHNDIVTVDKMNEAIAEGGGGSIATAEVTFINLKPENDASYGVLLTFPINESYGPIYVGETPVSVNVPLYNGAYRFYSDTLIGANVFSDPVVSGLITLDEETYSFIVRGDGTISLAVER